MLHKLVRLFTRWNERLRAQPARFHDHRFGSVQDVAQAQAAYLTALAEEDDLAITFIEHGGGRQRALPPAPDPPSPPTEGQ